MLKYFDDDLLDKLFGFFYARTKDSYEAEELCSDIRYELVKAAKAIECGYLYRDGDMLYTKILVNAFSDGDRLFDISNALRNGYFDADADIVAAKIAELIKKSVPDYLLGEWRLANNLASLPIIDAVVECLIEKGVLTPPENGIGAEGCWMSVES